MVLFNSTVTYVCQQTIYIKLLWYYCVIVLYETIVWMPNLQLYKSLSVQFCSMCIMWYGNILGSYAKMRRIIIYHAILFDWMNNRLLCVCSLTHNGTIITASTHASCSIHWFFDWILSLRHNLSKLLSCAGHCYVCRLHCQWWWWWHIYAMSICSVMVVVTHERKVNL